MQRSTVLNPQSSRCRLAVATLLTADQYTNQSLRFSVRSTVSGRRYRRWRDDGLLASGSAFVGVTSDQVSQIQQTAASTRLRWSIKSIAISIHCTPEETAADSVLRGTVSGRDRRLLFRRPLSDSRLSDLVQLRITLRSKPVIFMTDCHGSKPC